MLIILISIFASVTADIASDTVKRLKNFPSTDACDDFYRHACPFKSTQLKDIYEMKARTLANDIINSPFAHYEIMTDFADFRHIYDLEKWEDDQYLELYYSDFILDGFLNLYYNQCVAGKDTTKVMEYFEKLLTIPYGYQEQCGSGSFCASHVAKDEDCKRGRRQLKKNLKEMMEKQEIVDWNEKISDIQKTLQLNFLKVIGAHIVESNANAKRGMKIIRKMFDDMKDIYKDWVKKTKWAQRNDAVPYLTSLLDKLALLHDFTATKDAFSSSLKNAEFYYLKCKQEIGLDDWHAHALCLICANEKEGIYDYDTSNAVVGHTNAWNAHPKINIAIPLCLAADDIKSEAGRIGYIGSTLAHEIGHSVVEDYKVSNYLPFFSKIATSCIQETFRNTCMMFKEKSCAVEPTQVDENGPDILASQIAYTHFRNVFGDDYNKIYKPLGITHEQLFFYSISIFECSGEPSSQYYDEYGVIDTHSANNIRVNVYAQIPEFREAFDCSNDSRMVKVAKKPCFIYGPKAPKIRKR